MGKPAFQICENKDADQLRSNREADQRLCFRYTDSQGSKLFLGPTRPVGASGLNFSLVLTPVALVLK